MKTMKCSVCKEEGHNKRTCPNEKRPAYWKSNSDPKKCHFCEEELDEEECEAYETQDANFAVIASGKGYQPDLIAPICGDCQTMWCWCSEGPCPNPCPSCNDTCDQECGCTVECSRCEEGECEFNSDSLKWDSKFEQKEPVCEKCQAGTS